MQEGKHTCKFMREKQRQKSAQIRSSLCRISSGFYSNGGYCMETGHRGVRSQSESLVVRLCPREQCQSPALPTGTRRVAGQPLLIDGIQEGNDEGRMRPRHTQFLWLVVNK